MADQPYPVNKRHLQIALLLLLGSGVLLSWALQTPVAAFVPAAPVAEPQVAATHGTDTFERVARIEARRYPVLRVRETVPVIRDVLCLQPLRRGALYMEKPSPARAVTLN